MKQLPFLTTTLLLFLISCGSDTSKPNATLSQFPNPTTPEATVRLWQQYIDENKFGGAQKLSTDRGKEWITAIERFLADEDLDEQVTETEFLTMECVEKEANAFCVYTFLGEEGEMYEDTFFLVKNGLKWLVDIPEDEGIPTDEELIEFFEETLEDLPQ